jgi:uncharacterized protein YraI
MAYRASSPSVSFAVSLPHLQSRRFYMKSKTPVFLLRACLLAALFVTGSAALISAQASGVSGTTTGSVNMRAGPGTNYSVIIKLPAGTALTVTGSATAEWLAVRTADGKSGYVSGEFVRLSGASTGGTAAKNPQGYKPGDPGPNGGIVYSVGGSYMEVTRPDKALYCEHEEPTPPAPWRLPSPAELTQIYTVLQKTGLADYGDYWYRSNKWRDLGMAPQGEPVPGAPLWGEPSYRIVLASGGSIALLTFVRLKDGAVGEAGYGSNGYEMQYAYEGQLVSSTDGTAPGRVVYVRSFDPGKPPAAVPAGKPVAPPLPRITYIYKYEVGGKGPKGGIVYEVDKYPHSPKDYMVSEALAPGNAIGPKAVPPAGYRFIANRIQKAQKAGLTLENRWYIVYGEDKTEMGLYENGKFVEYVPAYDVSLSNPATGEGIQAYRLEGETEFTYKRSGTNRPAPDPELNAIVISAPCVFDATSELQAEAVRQ